MRYLRWMAMFLLGWTFCGAAAAEEARLLRRPSVSRDQVVFAYAGDLWIVSRQGGDARRLTATPELELDPVFSPDGTQIAFTATVAGNTDVYVIPAAGGNPRRLTYHPALDAVRGWTPDGRRILFASDRETAPHAHFRLWTISAEGGFPEPLPMPRAYTGSFSPDGRRIAYEEIPTAFIPAWAQNQASQWRHYRGGRTHPVRILHLGDFSEQKQPWTNSNDTHPMWIGNTIYFLSDRNFTVNLFAYDLNTRRLTQLTRHEDFDIQWASAGPGAIVYEQAGYVHLFDVRSGRTQRLSIRVSGDLPWARPQFKSVASMIRNAALSPTGVRAAFEARGEIFTVPVEKGDVRNLTQSSGAHDRSPVWSPDGTQLAWFSDASGEYQLYIGDQRGTAQPRVLALPEKSFFSSPAWSPDGKQILFHDNHLRIWLVEVASGKLTLVDTDTYHDPAREPDAAWSPDSQWIAYSKSLENHLRAIFLYSLATGQKHQITDGMSDAVWPAFDASGKYLYFLASTNYGPRGGWLEMSSLDRPVRRAIYLVVLRAGEPSPLLPETGDEAAAEKPAEKAEPRVQVDFENLSQRILALNVPAGDYSMLRTGASGTIFYVEPLRMVAAGESAGPAPLRLHRYTLRERSAAPFLEGIRFYTLSGDRKKLLYHASGTRWGVVATDRPGKVGDGLLDLSKLQMRVDPRAEWAQIFRETWRIQRDFFYDPQMHGANWEAVYQKYLPLLQHVGHRADLSYLIATVGGELAVGHSYLTGEGDLPGGEPVSVGLLGADFAIENGRYRIKRIYAGENWNPDLQAPLSAPGIDVAEGDYLLEVNGRPLVPPTNLYSLFEGTAGRQTLLRVSKTPSLEGSRLVTVIPVASDQNLRTRAWVEANRRKVDELSGGRLAYVWLPNTGTPGYQYFNRYYFAQQHKQGAIIDERYNQGGMVADYIVNELDRKLLGYFATRDGQPSTSPMAGLYGPKVMIINESAGSGGDALPYYFRLRKLGPLVGTRTWGALVGTLGFPPTIDGGGITAPNLAFYNLQGQWDVENIGVAPDIEVENTTADFVRGRDPQLERAVQEALKLLEQNPPPRVPRPAPIDRVSRPGGN